MSMRLFRVLRSAAGISRIDPKDLEKRFYALSRKLHPDLHSRKSAAERQQALEATAVLNDAYRTLRDPDRACRCIC